MMTEITPEDAAAKRAAEQARIRKERRQAKIRAGGAERLNKITGLGGRVPGTSLSACMMMMIMIRTGFPLLI